VSASDVLSSIWDDVTGTQQPLDDRGVVLTAVLAVLLVVVPAAWGVSRHVVTIAHEGAHGVAALLTGRSLEGIRLHSDTSGLTVSRGKPRGPGMVATAFAGYVGPASVGLAAAYLLGRQHALAVLWLVVLLLALLLLQIRNFFGLYAVAVAGFAVFAVTWWGAASSRRPWRTSAPGSSSSPRPVRWSSCSSSAGGDRRARPTRTCSRVSPGCPGWCGWSSSWPSPGASCCWAAVGC
jgi:hypothetical protein